MQWPYYDSSSIEVTMKPKKFLKFRQFYYFLKYEQLIIKVKDCSLQKFLHEKIQRAREKFYVLFYKEPSSRDRDLFCECCFMKTLVPT